MKNGKYNKSNKGSRAIVLLMALMLLVGSAIGGTLAWLISTADPVTDTFTYGNITIALTEGANKEDLWTASKHRANSTDRENDFLYLTPGDNNTFNPYVKVAANSEPAYLFVKVVPANGVVTVGEKTTTFEDFLTYSVDSGWTKLQNVEHVYYRIQDATANNLWHKVITNDAVSVPDTVTREMVSALSDNTKPTLTVTAYAIQSENLKDTTADSNDEVDPIDAWTAMNAQLNPSNP